MTQTQPGAKRPRGRPRKPESFTPAPKPVVLHPGGFLRVDQVLALVPVSRSKLQHDIREGTFPPAVRLSGRIRLWSCEEVGAWLADLRKQPRQVATAAGIEHTRAAREASAKQHRAAAAAVE